MCARYDLPDDRGVGLGNSLRSSHIGRQRDPPVDLQGVMRSHVADDSHYEKFESRQLLPSCGVGAHTLEYSGFINPRLVIFIGRSLRGRIHKIATGHGQN